jgi:ferredoxin
MSAETVTIDKTRCDGCWACVRSCPSEALQSRIQGAVAEIAWTAGRCLFCRRCEAVCPRGAVQPGEPVRLEHIALEPEVLVRLPSCACPRCGRRFGAGPQRSGPEAVGKAREDGRLLLCPLCRQREAFQGELAGRGEGSRC